MASEVKLQTRKAWNHWITPVLIVFALAPFGTGLATYLNPELGPHRWPMVMVQFCLAAYCVALVAAKKLALIKPSLWVLFATVILVSVWFASSRLSATSQLWAEYYLARNLALLTIGWMVYSMCAARSGNAIRSMVIALMVGSSLQLLLSALIISIEAGNPNYAWEGFHVGVTHVRHLSYLAMIQIALAAGLFATEPQGLIRNCYAAALLLGFYFACLSGGRVVIVAGVLVAFWCVYAGRPELRKQNFFLVVCLFVTAVALSLLYVPPNQQWGLVRLELGYYGRSGDGQFAGDRNLLWARAIELFKDHPWIGHGEGQFARLADLHWHANHPHNSLLQMLVAWGIIGSAAALYLFGYAIISVRKQVARVPELTVAPCAVLAGLSVVSLLDGPFFYAFPAMIFVIAAVLIRAAANHVTA